MSYTVHCDGTINLNMEYDKVVEIKNDLDSDYMYCDWCSNNIDEDTGENTIALEIHISANYADEGIMADLKKHIDETESGEIYCRGEGGELWRHVFEGGRWWLENAVITYERDPDGWA